MSEPQHRLERVVELPGAVLLGLGSMVGTGVYVSIGLAAGVAGPAVLLSILLAGALAACNGLSSAQLAGRFPVSGGTYEYGHRTLTPALGFSAGWLFLLAKSASAATAALGVAGYGLGLLGVQSQLGRSALAAGAALAITALVAGGLRRSNRGNGVLVGISVGALLLLVAAAVPAALERGGAPWTPFLPGDAAAGAVRGVLHGAALMFVAFTGYGRVATLGEEVRRPRHVIPRAVAATVVAVLLLYLLVAAAGTVLLGAGGLAEHTREGANPLEAAAAATDWGILPVVIAAGATAAMAGVLLNLVLGLSRVLLAMSRRRDMPARLARVEAEGGGPVAAVWAVGIAITLLALVGDVRTTWSFSAFTVLVYYALTNLAALRLPPEGRWLPAWVPAAGLVGCLGLALWVEPWTWAAGLGLLAAGLVGRRVLSGQGGRSV